MRSKDLLKQALNAYDGTLIVVSHDREFLNGLTRKVYEFGDKKIKEYRGGIYDYLGKRNLPDLKSLNAKTSKQSDIPATAAVGQKQIYLERKDIDREIRKTGSKLQKVEEEIDGAEKEIAKMDKLMAESPPSDDRDFFSRYDKLKKTVESNMMKWERLQYELDILNEKRNSVN
jgi:ATP-binding cassette subfamily F protein 3